MSVDCATTTQAISLARLGVDVLQEANPHKKAQMTNRAVTFWGTGQVGEFGHAEPPRRPARPDAPVLLAPREMPRRRLGSEKGRAAFLHAIAHIECNAIDLAWDILVRFAGDINPAHRADFINDWLGVAADEAQHFIWLSGRLSQLGYVYGDFPAHDGLWEAAEDTQDDLLARLALVPMVLEARGLDATPDAEARLRRAEDHVSADILAKIAEEEIPHVAAGVKWFSYVAEQRGRDPEAAFQQLIRERFKGHIKPPFNERARNAAGFPARFYQPLASEPR